MYKNKCIVPRYKIFFQVQYNWILLYKDSYDKEYTYIEKNGNY